MLDTIGPAEAAEVAESMLNQAAERDQQRDATIPELAAVAQVYVTLVMTGRLAELTEFVRSVDIELSNIRAVLEYRLSWRPDRSAPTPRLNLPRSGASGAKIR